MRSNENKRLSIFIGLTFSHKYCILFIIIIIFFVQNLLKSALGDINCYVCDATDEKSLFQCGEWFERYDDPQIKPQNCSGVHGARYCIKHIGRFEGNDQLKEKYRCMGFSIAINIYKY